MSAYGAIKTPQSKVRLLPRTYPLAKEGEALTIFPVRRDTVPQPLVEYLAQVFNDTVEDGRTYPQQEKLSLDEFVSHLKFCGASLARNLSLTLSLVQYAYFFGMSRLTITPSERDGAELIVVVRAK
jgi:hypothetical protein